MQNVKPDHDKMKRAKHPAKEKQVICKSGIKGSQGTIQGRYETLEIFEGYSAIYDINTRLGYETAEECWNDNPIIRSSTDPNDLEIVGKNEREYTPTAEQRVSVRLQRVNFVPVVKFIFNGKEDKIYLPIPEATRLEAMKAAKQYIKDQQA